MRRQGNFEKCDPRILGSGNFFEFLLDEAVEKVQRQLTKAELIAEAGHRIKRRCADELVALAALIHGSRKRNIASMRAQLTADLTGELGLSMAETAMLLGVSTSGIARILERAKFNKST